MKNFQQKRVLQNIAHSWPVLLGLSLLVLFFAWGMVGFVGKMIETRKNRQRVENKVAELEKEKEKLNSDIAQLKTEEGTEASIREKFGLAKEGEEMIVIVEDMNPPFKEDVSKKGFFSFFWNWFK